MKADEIRELSSEELDERVRTLKRELYDLRVEAHTGRIEKPSRFRVLRREVARILTIRGEQHREE